MCRDESDAIFFSDLINALGWAEGEVKRLRARVAAMEPALRACALELRHTNQQLVHEGYNEGRTVTDALAKADALLK